MCGTAGMWGALWKTRRKWISASRMERRSRSCTAWDPAGWAGTALTAAPVASAGSTGKSDHAAWRREGVRGHHNVPFMSLTALWAAAWKNKAFMKLLLWEVEGEMSPQLQSSPADVCFQTLKHCFCFLIPLCTSSFSNAFERATKRMLGSFTSFFLFKCINCKHFLKNLLPTSFTLKPFLRWKRDIFKKKKKAHKCFLNNEPRKQNVPLFFVNKGSHISRLILSCSWVMASGLEILFLETLHPLIQVASSLLRVFGNWKVNIVFSGCQHGFMFTFLVDSQSYQSLETSTCQIYFEKISR